MLRKKLKSSILGKMACAAAAALLVPAVVAQAAMVIDVRATAVTGVGSTVSLDGKTVTMHEGDVVTYTTSINNVPEFGLFSYDLSTRTRNETYNNGTALSATPTDTILDPVHTTQTAGSHTWVTFNNPSKANPNYLDIPNSPAGLDPDTDIDVLGIHGEDNLGTTGIAQSSTPTDLWRVNYTALNLDDNARAFNRSVLVNAYGSGIATTNGQAVILVYSEATADTSLLHQITLGPSNFGPDVSVTTLPVPEPASIGVLGLAAVGFLARRRKA